MGQRLNDRTRAAQAKAGTREDALDARGDEAVDEVLGEASIDMGDLCRCSPPSVLASVIDVDVEPVLVRHVSDAAGDAGAEVAAPRAAEVADEQTRRLRMGPAVLARDAQDEAHQPVGPVAAPAAARGSLADRIPGDVVWPRRGQADAADQPPGRRRPQRDGRAPGIPRARVPRRIHAWRGGGRGGRRPSVRTARGPCRVPSDGRPGRRR